MISAGGEQHEMSRWARQVFEQEWLIKPEVFNSHLYNNLRDALYAMQNIQCGMLIDDNHVLPCAASCKCQGLATSRSLASQVTLTWRSRCRSMADISEMNLSQFFFL